MTNTTHQIQVFISHSWTYSNHYDTLRKWLFEQRWWLPYHAKLVFHDRSVSKTDPIDAPPNSPELYFAVFGKMYISDVIVIPTGMYAHHSTWIRREIEFARALAKPILGVNLWGHERHSSVVTGAATAMAKWNSLSIVRKIWALSQHNIYTPPWYRAAYR